MSKLRKELIACFATTACTVAVAGGLAVWAGGASWIFVIVSLLPQLFAAPLLWRGINEGYPFSRLGLANRIAFFRLAISSLLFGFAMEIAVAGHGPSYAVAWIAAALALAGIALDGVDGWVARRQRMTSGFGARLDMEVDAFHILSLSLLAWLMDKAGVWVLLLGLMRYIFLYAGSAWPGLAAQLQASWRRKAVCVWTGLSLTVMLTPMAGPPASGWIAALALVLLCYSFLVDTVWLMRQAAARG